MVASLLAVRLIGPKERRHGTCFGNLFAFGAMAKPPCPSLPSEALTRNRLVTPEKVECLHPAELNISQHIKMPSSVTSKELIEKSVQAAVSAIELYNKPDFKYRDVVPHLIFGQVS
jgi:hypothetical protein